MQKQIKNIISYLNKGNIILYPTDTVYGIGCDATNKKAVNNIYKLKKREESKSLIILVDSFQMLENYVGNVSDTIKAYLSNTVKPTTVIYNNPKNLPNNLIATDNTIAIRIVTSGFVYELIKEFGKPIISTSANISGEKTPLSFNEISNEIKNNVDFIVTLYKQESINKASQIIKEINGKIEFIRK